MLPLTLDGSDMIGQFLLREGQRLAYQACNALLQRVVEALDVMGFPSLGQNIGTHYFPDVYGLILDLT